MNTKQDYRIKIVKCVITFLATFVFVSINGMIHLHICYASEYVEESESSLRDESEQTNDIKAQELDLGEYYDTMVIGSKQLLTVTVLPMNSTEQEITYNSSNEDVATINGMGRIEAIGVGKTTITVTCGEVIESFVLKVCEEEDVVEDLDIADCPTEIVVGTSELLSISVIPADATNAECTFSSDNIEVASVNALGRITGNAIGTANITIICGDVKKTFSLSVVPEKAVTDIEIGDYESQLEIGETLYLSAVVLPSDLGESATFYSSDDNIATVNSSGEVKGISSGEVYIYISLLAR